MNKNKFYLVWTVKQQLDVKDLKKAKEELTSMLDDFDEFCLEAVRNSERGDIKVDLVVE